MTRPAAGADAVPVALLVAAAERGVISTEQLDTLLASAGLGRDVTPARALDRLATGRTTPLGIAYRLGALLVLVASGWLLADQWEALGPTGVTLVTGAYLLVSVLASLAADARGQHRAAAWLATLSVALTPLFTWGVMWWTGWWPASVPGPHDTSAASAELRPVLLRGIVLESVTVVASLLARRAHENTTHTLLFIWSLTSLAFSAWTYAWNTAETTPPLDAVAGLWGCAMVLMGYVIDRREAQGRMPTNQPDVWYTSGLVGWIVVVLMNWEWFGPWRHAVAVLSAVAWLWAGVQLGRRAFATAGALAMVSYLVWLTRDTLWLFLSGPTALLGVGMLVLLGAVWAQRRFPVVLQRWVRWRPEAALTLPGGWTTAAVPLAGAAVLAVLRSVTPR